uniref:Uncharacterized protein n=1 Tax=Setaria viridis TaxID=4556 RepID=A0A4U6TFY9_SETVI|nr:hypothetical protein SEVIR_8G161900v2 [Setaria viridis]
MSLAAWEIHEEGCRASGRCQARAGAPPRLGTSRAGCRHPPPAPFPSVGSHCVVLLLLRFASCCKRMFQVFQKNVASVSCGCCKVDLDVAYVSHMFYLDVAFSIKDLNVPCNMKQMLRQVFFLIINE